MLIVCPFIESLTSYRINRYQKKNKNNKKLLLILTKHQLLRSLALKKYTTIMLHN